MTILTWFRDIFSSNLNSPTAVSDEFSRNSFDQTETNFSDNFAVNPANGLPMIGGMGGVDISGNAFGTDSSNDHFTSSSFSDSWNSSSGNGFSDW
jgi:nitrous oxidase accessory protein NosD